MINTDVEVILQGMSGEAGSVAKNVFTNRKAIIKIAEAVATLEAEREIENDPDITGLCVNFANKTFARLGAAYELTAGADFDQFAQYGGRRRCNVADDGTILAFYGDDDYAEDGSNGQVMVYQPVFFYRVAPLELEKISDGIGWHIRKANYYVSPTPKNGFKRHPLFYDANGKPIEYVLDSAFKGSIFDVSANDGEGAYLVHDEQVADFTATTGDKLCSIAGVKPASGVTQNLTRANTEKLAANRGSGWHCDSVKMEMATALLMMIEYGSLNMQTALGRGVCDITDSSKYSCSSITGSTSSLGNASGVAASTVNEINGHQTTYTTNGKTSISWRGKEDVYGNIWSWIEGLNVHGDGTQKGGIPYIANNLAYADNKITDNYESAGFTLTNESGYISAFGYGNEDHDWLMLASETTGNSALPVGDRFAVTTDLNGHHVGYFGGSWTYADSVGGFSVYVNSDSSYRVRTFGGRLVYVPTAKA